MTDRQVTQNRKVMMTLLRTNGITQRDVEYLGIKRLASRICDLRKAGMDITSKLIEVTNADGTKSRVARYSSSDYSFAYKYGRNCLIDGEVCHRQAHCYSCEHWQKEFWDDVDIRG